MINSSNLTKKYSGRFQGLVLLTLVIIYLLVLAGGIVRSTGSGMGCPDWPKCFGRWIPPTEISQLPLNYKEVYGAKLKGEVEFNAVKTWIEYVNRLLGAFAGFLVLATVVSSLPYLYKNKPVFWGSFFALLLIGANGWLGSRVVATELSQYTITLHLLLAILVVFALLFVLMRLRTDPLSQLYSKKGSVISSLLIVTMSLSLIQVVLGAQVREALNEVVERVGYAQRDSWISSLDWRFYVHRSFSLVILALHIGLIYQLRKVSTSVTAERLTTILIALVAVEVMTGAIMAYFAVPTVAQPVHLLLAVVMVGLQFVIWLLLHPTLISTKRVFDNSRLQRI